MKNKHINLYILFISILVIVLIAALCIGRYSISPFTAWKAIFQNRVDYAMEKSIIMKLRLPRTIVALLSGMALSVSGLLYQELFQNQLVSPDLLGVSSGSGLGAAIAILYGFGTFRISALAFIFGFVTVVFTFCLSKIMKNDSNTVLVLSGIVVGSFMSGMLSIVKYKADAETKLADITYWLMGSFSKATMSTVKYLALVVIPILVFVFILRFKINSLAEGRDSAMASGVNYDFYRLIVIVVATLLTAITVAMAGTISWIGLVVPHIVRLISKREATITVPLCMVLGGLFMIIVDVIARSISHAEIPLSAITSTIGTVIFAIILYAKNRKVVTND